MTDAFYSLGLNQDQLADLHRAVLARYIADEVFRRERGEESNDPPALLTHLEKLLDLSEEAAHRLFHEEEDRLWEYSWYAYTEEWAWYRARQEVERDLGDRAILITSDDLEQQIEKVYDDNFDRYTKEIDMASTVNATSSKKPSSRRAKK